MAVEDVEMKEKAPEQSSETEAEKKDINVVTLEGEIYSMFILLFREFVFILLMCILFHAHIYLPYFFTCLKLSGFSATISWCSTGPEVLNTILKSHQS